MDQISITSDTSALASVANLLNALGGTNANGSTESKLFTDFLNQNQDPVNLQTAAVADNTAQTPVTTAAPTTGSMPTPTLPSLKQLAAAWNRVLHKLQNQTENHSQSTFYAGEKTAPSSSSNVSTTSLIASSATSAAANATSDDSSNNDDDSVNLKDPKGLAEILSELQVLAQLIAKKLQQSGTAQGATVTASAAAGATGTDATTAANMAVGAAGTNDLGANLMNALKSFVADLQKLESGTGSSTTSTVTNGSTGASANAIADTAGLPQGLSNLLSLAQDIAQQLEDGAQNLPSTTSATSTADATPSTAALAASASAPLTFNVQSLLTALKAGNGTLSTTKGTATGSGNFLTAKASSDDKFLAAVKTTSVEDAAANDAKASAATSAPTNIAKNNALQSNPFLNSLGSATSNGNAAATASTAFIPLEPSLTGSDNGDASLDMSKDQQDSGAFSAASSSVQGDGSNLPSAVEQGSSGNPYSFASQLAVTKGSVMGATGLPPAVEQVMLQLNRSVKGGNDQMTLQLNPADLGRVNIKLDIAADGKVQGTVLADNPQTLHLLLKDVRSLERALQDAGLRADPGSLQFNLSNGQSGQSSGQTAKNASQSSGNSTTQDIATDTAADSNDQSEIYYVTPGRVNLKV